MTVKPQIIVCSEEIYHDEVSAKPKNRRFVEVVCHCGNKCKLEMAKHRYVCVKDSRGMVFAISNGGIPE